MENNSGDSNVQNQVKQIVANTFAIADTHGPGAASEVLKAYVQNQPTAAQQKLQQIMQQPNPYNWGEKGIDRAMELAGRGQQMIAAPISAAIKGASAADVLRASGRAALGTEPKTSFSDIAGQVQQKYDVQSPLANALLAGGGAVGDVFIDPANFVAPQLKAEKILGGTVRKVAPAIEQKMAGVGESVFSREIPNIRSAVSGVKVAAKDLTPGTTGVIKSSDPLKTATEKFTKAAAAGEKPVYPTSINSEQKAKLDKLWENIQSRTEK